MFLETLWVKTNVKFAVPRAGLETPSIFCSTHGPRSVSVVVPALIACHGQANLTCGRWTLTPPKCRVADSATAAIALRNTRHATATAAPHRSRRRIRRRERDLNPLPPGAPGDTGRAG